MPNTSADICCRAQRVTQYWIEAANLYRPSALYIYSLSVRVTLKERVYRSESEGWFLRISLSGGRKQYALHQHFSGYL